MRTKIPNRLLSLLLVIATLLSMLGSTLAFAVEVPAEEEIIAPEAINSEEETAPEDTFAAFLTLEPFGARLEISIPTPPP